MWTKLFALFSSDATKTFALSEGGACLVRNISDWFLLVKQPAAFQHPFFSRVFTSISCSLVFLRRACVYKVRLWWLPFSLPHTHFSSSCCFCLTAKNPFGDNSKKKEKAGRAYCWPVIPRWRGFLLHYSLPFLFFIVCFRILFKTSNFWGMNKKKLEHND